MINIFFTIASNKYGYGHLKRCEIISNKFKKDINWIVLMNKRVDKKIMKNNSSIKYLSLSKFQKQLKKKNVEFIIKYIFLDFANSKFIKQNKSFQKLDF